MHNTEKAVLTGKTMTLNIYNWKQEKSKVNNLNLKKKDFKSKASRLKEIIKIRTEINGKKHRKIEENQWNWKMIKFDKALARLTNRKRHKLPIS